MDTTEGTAISARDQVSGKMLFVIGEMIRNRADPNDSIILTKDRAKRDRLEDVLQECSQIMGQEQVDTCEDLMLILPKTVCKAIIILNLMAYKHITLNQVSAAIRKNYPLDDYLACFFETWRAVRDLNETGGKNAEPVEYFAKSTSAT